MLAPQCFDAQLEILLAFVGDKSSKHVFTVPEDQVCDIAKLLHFCL